MGRWNRALEAIPYERVKGLYGAVIISFLIIFLATIPLSLDLWCIIGGSARSGTVLSDKKSSFWETSFIREVEFEDNYSHKKLSMSYFGYLSDELTAGTTVIYKAIPLKGIILGKYWQVVIMPAIPEAMGIYILVASIARIRKEALKAIGKSVSEP